MLGAIIGDIIGSVYEFNNEKDIDKIVFFKKGCSTTDDSIMTMAVSRAVIKGYGNVSETRRNVISEMRKLGRGYLDKGYGSRFKEWLLSSDPKPYASYGNGGAMRVSSVGFIYDDLDDVLRFAEATCSVTHNDIEAINGAQAIASAIFIARHNKDKSYLKEFIEKKFNYDLEESLDEIREDNDFDVRASKTVPLSIISFLQSDSFSDCLLNALSLGGDSDTLASMAGAIAEAYYGIPEHLEAKALKYLDKNMREIIGEYKDFLEILKRVND